MSLAELTRFRTVEGVLSEARTRQPPCIRPEIFKEGAVRVLAYPGDDRHPVRSRALPGPTRLYWRNNRFETEGGLEALVG